MQAQTLYDQIVIEDVRMAADILRPSYNESGGADGFVSIEGVCASTTDAAATNAKPEKRGVYL